MSKDLPARRTDPQPPVSRRMPTVQDVAAVYDHHDEIEVFEAWATKRSIERAVSLADFAREVIGNDELKAAVVLPLLDQFSKNQVDRARSRREL